MNALVRLPNWLGDTVMAIPLLRSLRTGLEPSARITGVGPWAWLLAGEELVDARVDYPRSWAGRLAAVGSIGPARPDLALVLPNSFESALAARYWRARRRIGYDTAGRGILLTDRLPLPSPRRHQVDEYLGLLAPLGIEPALAEPRLRPPDAPAELAEVDSLLAQSGAPETPRVGVHLGAAFGPSKVWSADRIAGLCARLPALGMTALLLGTAADGELARSVQRLAQAPIPTLVGRDRPALLPALLARLDALVSGDTGIAHLAAALGTPVVALFGPTDPALSSPRGPAIIVAKEEVPCAPCFLSRCPIDHVCMRSITVDEVAEALLPRLGRQSAAPARLPSRGPAPPGRGA
jgi:lipopolysaccharide heptosyltransferase II